MTGYYDYVLGLIPATLFGVTIALHVFGIPLTSAVSVGGGASALLVAHALFINSPVDAPRDAHEAIDAPARSGPAPNAD